MTTKGCTNRCTPFVIPGLPPFVIPGLPRNLYFLHSTAARSMGKAA